MEMTPRHLVRLGLGFAVVALALAAPAPAQAQGSPHGSITVPCDQCHSMDAWSPLAKSLVFSHEETGFKLDRGHRQVDCQQCHEDLRFQLVASACADCHADPHRGEMGYRCEACHSPKSWDNRREIYDLHSATLFPLTGVHAVIDCESCHREEPPFEFALTPTECFACHQEDYLGTEDPNHVEANFSTRCEQCHRTTGWEGALGVNHDEFFPLTGSHAVLDCLVCHSDGFAGTPTDCFACHSADYDATRDPNHREAGFPTDCEQCHDTLAWEGADFDHNLLFPLSGAHAVLDCEECHASGFAGTPSDCVDCHQAEYDGTDDPNHREAGFPTDCEQCHTSVAWEGAEFNHNLFFRLDGAHTSLDCEECHADGFAGTPSDCFACHQADYNGTDDPNHRQAGFPTDCEACHTTRNWDAEDFDHDLVFRLDGTHAALDCEDCHTDGFAGTQSDCFACHQADYNGTNDPDHREVGYSTDCAACHNTRNWEDADFDHNTFFRLDGAHTTLDCVACHADGYAGTPSDCYSCHQTDYNGTDDPNHLEAGYSTDCEQCHNTTDWEDADFDHNLFFRLDGAHRTLDCIACHADGYAGTPSDCYSCHQTDYNGTDDPNHLEAGYSTDCEQCHNTTDWEDADFDHNAFFRLDGAHKTLDCVACHADGYAGTPTDCYSCHKADYDGTDDPDHALAGYPTDCEQCHNTSDWDDADFNHNLYYPLTGAHKTLDCVACHADGYAGTPTDCWSCHKADYNGTDDPDHRDAGFPTDCEQCHNTSDWEDADFDHNLYYPLTGAHKTLDCIACHADGYPGTPTDCYSCHKADYNGTDDPDHQVAGFPTECELCHNTSDWDDAEFDHDAKYFPIYSGTHREVWDACSDCHTQPKNFSFFSCTVCHERRETDDDHDEVPGYVYESNACYSCHPRGRE